MKKTIKNKIISAIEGLTWKTVSRISYFVLVVAVTIYGISTPESLAIVLEAITKALSFIL